MYENNVMKIIDKFTKKKKKKKKKPTLLIQNRY